MAKYKLTDPKSGQVFYATGDSPPTEQEMEKLFAAVGKTSAPSPEAKSSGVTGSFATTADEARFPRTNALVNSGELTKDGAYTGKDAARLGLATAGDAASLIGRSVAALPAMLPGGETYGESYARTSAKPRTGFFGGAAEMAGNVLRDPATPLSAMGGSLIGAGAKTVGALKELGVKPLIRATGRAIGKSAIESTASAAAHQGDKFAQTGEASLKDAALETAVGTGLGAGMSGAKAVVTGTKGALSDAPERIMMNRLRPLAKSFDDGFDIKNVSKYNLFGEVPEIIANSDALIAQRANDLKSVVNNSAQKGAKVNMSEVLRKTWDEFTTNKQDRNFATAIFQDNAGDKPLQATAEKFSNYIKTLTDGRSGVGVDEALELKRIVGQVGDWSHGSADPSLAASEAFANKLYLNLRDAIDQALPEQAKQLNKEMSELIPINRAAWRRLPIEMRNDLIGLKQATIWANAFGGGAQGGLGGLALSIADKTVKSPMAASAMDLARKAAPPAGLTKTAGSLVNLATPLARQAPRTGLFMQKQEQ